MNLAKKIKLEFEILNDSLKRFNSKITKTQIAIYVASASIGTFAGAYLATNQEAINSVKDYVSNLF